MTAELEKMRIIQDVSFLRWHFKDIELLNGFEFTTSLFLINTLFFQKTKTELEARLKDGAKQYAKLYVKYDKLLKRSQIPSCETSN